MSDETPAETAKAKSVRKPKIGKPRPNSEVIPARSKADKERLAQQKNFVQVSLPKSLATMTDEEIMQWAKGLYKSVVEQLQPQQPKVVEPPVPPTPPQKQQISLVKMPNLKDMTDEERKVWASQLHAKLVERFQAKTQDEQTEPK